MSGGSLYRVLVQQPAAEEERSSSQDDRVTFSSDSPMAGLISHEKKNFFASLGVCCNDYSSPARRRALSFSLTCFAFWNILSRGGQEAYIWEVRLGICESSSCGLGYSSRYHLKRFSWPHQQWCIANTREGGQQAGAEEEKWPTSIPAFSYVIAQKKETSQVELLAKLVKGVQATL